MKNLLPTIGRYVNYTCMEYTIQKTQHITFSKWYNKEKRWRFHHEKTGQSFMDEYFMFHASRGFWISCVWTICRRYKNSNYMGTHSIKSKQFIDGFVTSA
ncbi:MULTISPECIES: hypothetical protein [Bacillus]|uniref:hypothetical protein n=1 Tax=Bacillus TaxID=1386 RepID=UPI000BEFC568|nr:hypothetical protein [Bacillus mycoides]HDR7636248.1 hypothetical protein [Bacillus mycoides]HDR7637152.1 hypothetical protein [Bacillus mycoides]